MALRLLKSVLPQPTLTLEAAMDLVEYHLKRNRVAKAAHTKAWRKRHKKLKVKVLL